MKKWKRGMKTILKNNKERLEYIQDPNNWLAFISDNTGLKIKVEYLNGTDLCRISVQVEGGWWSNNEPHFCELGVFPYNPNSSLKHACSLSFTAQINHIKEL